MKKRFFESGIRVKNIVEYKFNHMPMVDNMEIVYHGQQYIFRFPNGYGASVIRYVSAYCDLGIFDSYRKYKEYKPKDLRTYEVGLLKNGILSRVNIGEYFLDEPIEGHLTYQEVNKILNLIEEVQND